MSTIGGIAKGIERASKLGYQCTQIYATSSRTWNVGTPCSDDIQEYAKRYNITLIGHIPLIVNLVSENDIVREKSLKRLSQEISFANKYGIKTLVLHPGSTLDNDINRGINCLINALNGVFDTCKKNNVMIALETMSGQGTQLGSRFDELANIINGVKNNSHIAVCLDTCHLYAAGYQIESRELLYKTLNEFDKQIGIKKINAIHLNNTKVELGKKTDRHSSIFDGNIGLETFEAIFCDRRFEQIPIVLEPSSKDITGAEQVEYLQKIVREKKL